MSDSTAGVLLALAPPLYALGIVTAWLAGGAVWNLAMLRFIPWVRRSEWGGYSQATRDAFIDAAQWDWAPFAARWRRPPSDPAGRMEP